MVRYGLRNKPKIARAKKRRPREAGPELRQHVFEISPNLFVKSPPSKQQFFYVFDLKTNRKNDPPSLKQRKGRGARRNNRFAYKLSTPSRPTIHFFLP